MTTKAQQAEFLAVLAGQEENTRRFLESRHGPHDLHVLGQAARVAALRAGADALLREADTDWLRDALRRIMQYYDPHHISAEVERFRPMWKSREPQQELER